MPLHLLGAAAYQIAGYPARAAGLLREGNIENVESEILRAFLKTEFPALLRLLTEYWQRVIPDEVELEIILPWQDTEAFSDRFHQWIVNETISALGVLCGAMRWGDENRINRAIEKLVAVGKVILHGNNAYSWLLAKLCAEVAAAYIESSMRRYTVELATLMNPLGKEALERYLRWGYQSDRTLAWPSQVSGIERLIRRESFTLCTPTGSGKTTVAELAILQSLFTEVRVSIDEIIDPSLFTPLVIYLVPSRALATEVEAKLSRILSKLNAQIIVTGLYGGTDWGPTDVWLTAEERTVLICTYEKIEALIRFIGPRFLRSRVSLVVIDEAHSIQFDGNWKNLQQAESRPLRLESLGTRLLTHLDANRSRIIALSAVAAGAEGAIANWISGRPNADPVKTLYRSTRQLIGRLECLPNRRTEIRYDLLDGATLQFEEGGQSDKPYVPNPFPPHPPALKWETGGPEKRLRPYLFWAAMHLAAKDDHGRQRAVLISITQQPGGYAEDFLTLLNSTWAEVEIPVFFQLPTDTESGKLDTWRKCLQSCEDYFGKQSREYQLLEKGVVVHHGKMPGLMARLLLEVIQERIVHLVLATSTLSEGVNLPFETVLIPSLRRWSGDLNVREFGNLVGRAGRPGFGTEGRSLVLLEPEPPAYKKDESARQIRQARSRYFDLVENLGKQGNENTDAQSPLAALIKFLEEKWRELTNSDSEEDFLEWLEKAEPLEENDSIDDANLEIVETLDTLDSLLLSAIVEIEQIINKDLNADELEGQLRQIWQRSYAFYASAEEAKLGQYFIRRGQTLKSRVYPEASQRRRLYRTSLPARSANQLINLYPTFRQHLETGEDYALWSPDERFRYIQTVVAQLISLPKFGLDEKAGRSQVIWSEVLHWWLDSENSERQPTKKQISDWHNYVSRNFGYRLNWGLGSIISLAMDEIYQGEPHEPTLEDWPQTGLPWIVFWLKELFIWGTLEPVAAYLLARGQAITRTEAEKIAREYYNEQPQDQSANELLNAVIIRNWALARLDSKQSFPSLNPPNPIDVYLLRDFSQVQNKNWRVVPVEAEKEILWLDPAGFPLARCPKFEGWNSVYLDTHDFTLA